MAALDYFPGFFDSDGRPWELTSLAEYQDGLLCALKMAFLTQKKLFMPAGYFLDNPALFNIIHENSGDNDECKAFKTLMKDLIVICVNESSSAVGGDKVWGALLEDWIDGPASNRHRKVYLNCVSRSAATAIQKMPDAQLFRREMTVALLAQREFDFQSYLDALDHLNFSLVPTKVFGFDSMVNERLLSGTEHFPAFDDATKEKVQSIAEAAKVAKIRLSRSLLRNSEFCLEIGAKQILSYDEYDRVAPVMGHYHHMAFATSLSMDSFATKAIPTIERKSKDLLKQLIDAYLRRAFVDRGVTINWPLSKVSFLDIKRIRIDNAKSFNNRLHDIAKSRNEEEFSAAMKEHSNRLRDSIPTGLGRPDIIDVSSFLAGMTFQVAEAGVGLALLKYALSNVAPFYSNIQKRLQVGMTFRTLS